MLKDFIPLHIHTQINIYWSAHSGEITEVSLTCLKSNVFVLEMSVMSETLLRYITKPERRCEMWHKHLRNTSLHLISLHDINTDFRSDRFFYLIVLWQEKAVKPTTPTWLDFLFCGFPSQLPFLFALFHLSQSENRECLPFYYNTFPKSVYKYLVGLPWAARSRRSPGTRCTGNVPCCKPVQCTEPWRRNETEDCIYELFLL